MILIQLGITLIIEETAALLWGLRRVRELMAVLWINAVTNPLVTVLRYLSNQWIHFEGSGVITIVVLELAVLLAEWRLFKRFIPRISHPLVFSLVMNASSYAGGLLIPSIMRIMATH